MDKFDYLKKKVETYAYVTMYIVSGIFVVSAIIGAMIKYLF